MQIARIVVGLALFAAAACSGQGLSKDEFIAQADEICREAEEATQEIEPPRTPKALGEFVDEAQRITGELLTDLRELGPPEEGEQTVESLYAKIEEAMDLLPEIKDAAENRNSARIQELGVELQEASSEANEIARGYGLEACGRTQTTPAS
jgi:hypothetical protein